MEAENIVVSKSKIEDVENHDEHRKRLARERKQRSREAIQRATQQRMEQENEAAKKEKKRINNLTAKWRSTLSPTGKLMDQLSFKDVHHVLAGLSALCALFRICSDVDYTQQRSNAILIVNDGLLYELYDCLHKRIENVSVVLLASELFASVLSLYPFSERCTTLRSTTKPWYDGHGKLFYDLFFVVIQRRDSCLDMSIKALNSLLCEVYARSTHRDRIAESKFTGTVDEETIILTLIATNVIDVGYGLSIYSKIIASGADTYRERACQVVCAVVVAQQAPVSLSLMTHAVEIFVKLLKNDDNKTLLMGPVGNGVKDRLQVYAFYWQGKIPRSYEGDKQFFMHSTHDVVAVYELLSKRK